MILSNIISFLNLKNSREKKYIEYQEQNNEKSRNVQQYQNENSHQFDLKVQNRMHPNNIKYQEGILTETNRNVLITLPSINRGGNEFENSKAAYTSNIDQLSTYNNTSVIPKVKGNNEHSKYFN